MAGYDAERRNQRNDGLRNNLDFREEIESPSMSKEPTPRQPRLDNARERIAAEKAARTGRLDLANLGLTHPPRNWPIWSGWRN